MSMNTAPGSTRFLDTSFHSLDGTSPPSRLPMTSASNVYGACKEESTPSTDDRARIRPPSMVISAPFLRTPPTSGSSTSTWLHDQIFSDYWEHETIAGNVQVIPREFSLQPSSLPLPDAPPDHLTMQPYQRHNYPPVNPADQNPPCNTLYVGNLPIDTSQDELRAIFSKQRGYKSLCFKTKHNEPMCFVGFEDVSFATKALNELYGYRLRDNVNEGIRLSFSKTRLSMHTGQPGGMGSPMLSPSGPRLDTNGLNISLPPTIIGAPRLSAPPGSNKWNSRNGMMRRTSIGGRFGMTWEDFPAQSRSDHKRRRI